MGAKSTKYWFNAENTFRKLAWLTMADSIQNSSGREVENRSSLCLVIFIIYQFLLVFFLWPLTTKAWD